MMQAHANERDKGWIGRVKGARAPRIVAQMLRCNAVPKPKE
jgi:hypothetical protein